MTATKPTIFSRLRSFIASYCHFHTAEVTLPLAFWIASTFVYEAFDTFPYLVITARTKRAGKTRLSELISFTCQAAMPVAGATAGALFRAIEDLKPTIIWDEAETLSSESANLLRAFLNVGYRKGQTIPRASGDGVKHFPTFCPKVFILIGDVYETLRDRSIIVEMERADSLTLAKMTRFNYETAKMEGGELAEELKELLAANIERITTAYLETDLSFLTDRNAEIWRPIFTLCKVFEPHSYDKLVALAADMCAEKTNPMRFRENKDEEKAKQAEEYGLVLLRDAVRATRNVSENRAKKRYISTIDLLEALRAIPSAPWRKFYSPSADSYNSGAQAEAGLTVHLLASLLKPFGLAPICCRMTGAKVFRGYDIAQIERAAEKWGVK